MERQEICTQEEGIGNWIRNADRTEIQNGTEIKIGENIKKDKKKYTEKRHERLKTQNPKIEKENNQLLRQESTESTKSKKSYRLVSIKTSKKNF